MARSAKITTSASAERRSALEGRAASATGVAVNPLPPAERISLRAPAESVASLSKALGVTLPQQPKTSASKDARTALWLGPDEFLLLDAEAASSDTAPDFHRLQEERACSVVDVSHRQMAWEITGASAETILAGACPLDLDAEHFPIGMCTRTVLAKADIVLWRTREAAFHLEAWRSFSGYVTGLLREIAIEFYGP